MDGKNTNNVKEPLIRITKEINQNEEETGVLLRVTQMQLGSGMQQPVVAVGNVGQLAIDLLLSTLEAKHVGYLNHSSVLPIVGPDPFDGKSKKIVTSWQIYDCPKNKLVIVQQRAPIALDRCKEYRKFVVDWIKNQEFQMTILLSSSFSQFFTRDELLGIPMHYKCTTKARGLVENHLMQLSWKEFFLGSSDSSTDASDIPGGGVTRALYDDCELHSIPIVVLILICSEGNNYPEAIYMADQLNEWLKVNENDKASEKWKIPSSWCLPFGNKPPSSVY